MRASILRPFSIGTVVPIATSTSQYDLIGSVFRSWPAKVSSPYCQGCSTLSSCRH